MSLEIRLWYRVHAGELSAADAPEADHNCFAVFRVPGFNSAGIPTEEMGEPMNDAFHGFILRAMHRSNLLASSRARFAARRSSRWAIMMKALEPTTRIRPTSITGEGFI
jgi:hypothetical protein